MFRKKSAHVPSPHPPSSTDGKARLFQEHCEEIQSLYRINKEIFKTNLASLGNEEYRKVLSGLSAENEQLFRILIQRFAQTTAGNPQEVRDPPQGATDASESESKHARKLQAEIQRLEAENRSLRAMVAKKETRLPPAVQPFTADALDRTQTERQLRDQVRSLEARLATVTRFKNELIRDRFVD